MGKPLDGAAVVESHASEFKQGDAVTSNYGWREYFIASSEELKPFSREIEPLSVYLGALGMTGMTAWTVGWRLPFSYRTCRAFKTLSKTVRILLKKKRDYLRGK